MWSYNSSIVVQGDIPRVAFMFEMKNAVWFLSVRRSEIIESSSENVSIPYPRIRSFMSEQSSQGVALMLFFFISMNSAQR
jgi:hypothetical protein